MLPRVRVLNARVSLRFVAETVRAPRVAVRATMGFLVFVSFVSRGMRNMTSRLQLFPFFNLLHCNPSRILYPWVEAPPYLANVIMMIICLLFFVFP
jgi:hypothetical protein